MKIYILLAEGFETIEAMAPIDIFRRAGVNIESVSITDSPIVLSSQGVETKADRILKETDMDEGDALILPGGYPGYKNLAESEEVGEIVKDYFKSGRVIGAICGAPTVLARYGVAKGYRVTSFHTTKEEMKDYIYTGKPVEQDRNIITAIGAGHAIDFGLALLYALQGGEKVAAVKAGMELA